MVRRTDADGIEGVIIEHKGEPAGDIAVLQVGTAAVVQGNDRLRLSHHGFGAAKVLPGDGREED